MNITFKNIPKFQSGGVPQWYLDRYGNRTSLLGWNFNKRYDYSNKNLNANDHRNAGNLDTVYRKNMAYIGTPGAISSDILAFYDSDGNGMSAQDFVNYYNTNATKIRNHWNINLIYNAKTAGDHNRLFKRMFSSRSNQYEGPGSSYNIGYLNNLEDIEGSSTWLRRMDLYEKEFDINNPDSNRMHEITLSDGSKAIVYKKANGDIGLFKNNNIEISPILSAKIQTKEEKPNLLEPNLNYYTKPTTLLIPAQHTEKSSNKLDLSKYIPGLLDFGRLAGNLINNNRVYDEMLKSIKPDLRDTYHTYRQVVGDEATKLAFYKRAAQGQTSAAKPFTSDADKQIAYQMEAKKVGDELRTQGDLADNAEIRRTSDESNQHQWENTRRDNEVATYNRFSRNRAEADRHRLLALKHSALWSNIDLYLLGLTTQARKNLAKKENIDDLIFALLQKIDLSNDLEYNNAIKKYTKIVSDNTDEDGNINWDKIREAKLEYDNAGRLALLRSLQRSREHYNGILFSKGGSKITKTRKIKDDLLYKTSKDIVEHFRKMIKISSDDVNRRRPIKIEKLTHHPKGKTVKYQLGGVAPFTIYRPSTLGGEDTITSTQNSTSSTDKNSSKEDLDLLKELFKSLSIEGLPSDANTVYKSMNALLLRLKAFGEELSTEDIQSMYVRQMLKINTIKFNKAQYDSSLKIVNDKNALFEYAIDLYGRVVVLDLDGNISLKTLSLVLDKKGVQLLTNGDLLSLRALSPSLAFNNNLLNITNNATSMSEISKFLKELLPKIGTETIEGYTKLDSNNIKAGLQLLKDAPAGNYKFTSKEQSKQAQMALEYLVSILPKNMKTLLTINAEELGTTPIKLISAMIGSSLNSELQFDAVTGKAAKDSNGNSKVGGDDGLKLDAATALVSGKGYKESMEFNTGTSYAVTVNGVHTEFQKKSGENMGLITMNEALQSSLKGVLDFDKATLGGSRLNPMAYNHVVINNGDVIGVDLPVGNDKDVPDFTMLKKLQTLDLELLKRGIQDTPENFQQVNQVCLSLGIPTKYDNSGKLNTYNWNRFAAFQVVTDDTALLNKSVLLEDMIKIADAPMRDLYEQFLQSKSETKDYDLGDGVPIVGWGKQELYQGTVFVPVKSNYVGAALSGGLNITMSQATDLEMREQGYDKLKIGSYTKQYKLTDLND